MPKALLLFGVYALHFILFQALLAVPDYDKDNRFEPLFAKDINNNIPKQHHPAATYFSYLMKQSDAQNREVAHAPAVVCQDMDILTPVSPVALISADNTTGGVESVPDISTERYLVIKVFRI